MALSLPPGRTRAETVMSLMRASMDDQTYGDVNGVFEQIDPDPTTTTRTCP